MKFIKIIIPLILLSACGTPKKITDASLEAARLTENSKYEEALKKVESIINYYEDKGTNAADTTYSLAANLAYKTDKIYPAVKYYESAIKTGSKDETVWVNLADCYKKMDNLSKEITTLEAYKDSFPEGKALPRMEKRLMDTYIESKNWTKATNLWLTLPGNKNNSPDLMEDYVSLLENTSANENTIYEASTKLLKLDPYNTIALKNIAIHFYKNAERRYEREMNTYEKHKTRRQYAYLLEQLKIVTKDYKSAAFYFEKLYKLDPQKEYAAYLSNIYLRLNNANKSQFYKKLSQ